MRVRRIATMVVGLVLVASALAPEISASASQPGPRNFATSQSAPQLDKSAGDPTPAGWESVTLQLTAQDQHAVDELSQAQGLTAETRRQMLRDALASPERQSTVAHFLTDHGLNVTDVSPLAVTAAGPSHTVEALFPNGTQPRSSATLAVPDELDGLVSFVISSAYTAITFHPLSTPRVLPSSAPPCTRCIDGPKARRLYDIPESAATTNGANITIATLQFSGWDSSSLTDFASNYGLPDPVQSGQYQEVSVGGADPRVVKGSADTEVALDQETLLAVAPQAHQVAYFAPNSAQGEYDALTHVASDALSNTVGLHYTALSISWGLCETDAGSGAMNAIHDMLTNVVAAGVTVFASSGDSGAYDCSTAAKPNNAPTVDYPASDPNVIGVGGLSTDVSNPSNPVETAWWNPSGNKDPAFLGYGSGGGASSQWLQTTTPWQTAVKPDTQRLVPDIALNGDPTTGQQIFIRNATDPNGTWGTVGGTSLSAPLAAATLTDLQIAHGPATSHGLGNIAPNLYGAPAASFRDTTIGSNGAYNAGLGYDTVTGLGAPLWTHLTSALFGAPTITASTLTNNSTVPITVTYPVGMQFAKYTAGIGASTEPTTCNSSTASPTAPTDLTVPADGSYTLWVMGYTTSGKCYLGETVVRVDTTAPTATIATPTTTFATGQTIPVTWATADVNGSGIATADVLFGRAPTSTTTPNTWSVWKQGTTLNGSSLTNAILGATYCFQVRAHDAAGNTSQWSALRCVTTPRDDRALVAKTAGWKRTTAAGYLANTYTSTSTINTSLATTSALNVRRIGLIATRCPSCGSVAVYIGATKVGTISLRAATTTSRASIVLPTLPAARSGIVKFIVTTKGKLVRIDGALIA